MVPPLFLSQLGHGRWPADMDVFLTLTFDCHLEHAATHQPAALPVWTMIRVPPYTPSLLFYHRQVVSRAGRNRPQIFRELARLLSHPTPALHSN